MRKYLLFTFLFLSSLKNGNSQTPDWIWASGASGGGRGFKMANDFNGNIFVTGAFQGPSLSFGTFTLTSIGPGFDDIFIVKYDSSGNVMWAKSAGGIYSEEPWGITSDSNGNVYITGSFDSPSITFGSTTLTNTSGSFNIFIVKYDFDGNLVWAIGAGDNQSDNGLNIATDKIDNLYATGSFSSSSITFDSTILIGVGIYNTYVIKLDTSGSVIWGKSISGTNGTCMDVDLNGNIYLSGVFAADTINFDSIPLYKTSGIGVYENFIVKYDSSGNVLWAKHACEEYSLNHPNIKVDTTDNLYFTGDFGGQVMSFDTIHLVNADTSGNSNDIFIAKYNTSGNLIWVKRIGGIQYETCGGVTLDKNGNILIGGSFQTDSVYFGSILLTNSTGAADSYVCKYDTSGNTLWAKSAGGCGNGWDLAADVIVNANENIYLTGSFACPTLTFGNTSLSGSDGTYFLAVLGNTTGIDEKSASHNTFSVFPNPVRNTFTLSTAAKHQNAQIEIYNPLGEKIYAASAVNCQLWTVDCRLFPPGIYFVKLSTENGSSVQKLVKQ
ncbi:MAG: SBBP repeat-containing protein [Bacteroidota bacterium]